MTRFQPVRELAPTMDFMSSTAVVTPDGGLIMGDEDSPKKAGGLWNFVTFIGVCIGALGVVSNILFIGDYKDDQQMYREHEYEMPMSVCRDIYM